MVVRIQLTYIGEEACYGIDNLPTLHEREEYGLRYIVSPALSQVGQLCRIGIRGQQTVPITDAGICNLQSRTDSSYGISRWQRRVMNKLGAVSLAVSRGAD
jgi:hypothetical protein